MKYDPDIHHRRSIRLREYDYSSNGAYYVTICVHGWECLFGEVAGGAMQVNPAGEMVQSGWQGLMNRFPNIILDEFTIMPNHFHGIICVVGAPLAAPAFESDAINKNATKQGAASTKQGAASSAAIKGAASSAAIKGAASSAAIKGAASSAPTLGSIMRVFKSISAIGVNRILDRQGRPLWQRNYYERVIRNERELAAARKYIVENPIKWDLDRENPVNTPQQTNNT